MRGKETPSLVVVRGSRITPAYAGKSLPEELEQALPKDHPRVCGEKSPFSLFRPPHLGSPPRMRGKVYSRTCSIVLDGITPAYAGKSFLMFLRSGLLRDHPRVCGEKGSRIFQDPAGMGSPPRMRGKVMRRFSASAVGGITPAYAGKRLLRQLRHITSRDHPRVCGEKSGRRGLRVRQWGSPPRMRGKESLTFHSPPFAGITPAYAGKRIPPLSSMLFA